MCQKQDIKRKAFLTNWLFSIIQPASQKYGNEVKITII